MFRAVRLLAVLALTWPVLSSAHTPSADSPLALAQHPRIWITPALLPELRVKVGGPLLPEFQRFVTAVDASFGVGPGKADWTVHGVNASFLVTVGSLPGVKYGHTPGEYLAEAKRMVAEMAAPGGFSLDVYQHLGICYDWLYPHLTESERRRAVDRLKSLWSGAPRIKDPWDGRSVVTTFGHVVSGLAFWGDGIDDAAAHQLVDLYYSQVTGGGALDANNIVLGSEGLSYETKSRTARSFVLLQLQEAWRTANGLDPEIYLKSDARVFRQFPEWLVQHVRPHATPSSKGPRGYEFVAWKTHFMDAYQPFNSLPDARVMLRALTMYASLSPNTAGLAQWILENRLRDYTVEAPARSDAVFATFILGRKGVTALSPPAAGLSLTNKTDGLGLVTMRTGWVGLTDTMVTFQASGWWRTSYSNRNQNSFTIDRRGPLVINSGDGIHHGYANSTWAHNTVIVPSTEYPDGTVLNWENNDKGGQRRLFRTVSNTRQLVRGSEFDLGGIKRYQPVGAAENIDFDYVLGDATRAYNSTQNKDDRNDAKISNFTRQLVYFRRQTETEGDQVVVFDRVNTTQTKFEKRWLLHVSAEPQVDGRMTPVREGKWESLDSSRVTVTNTQAGSFGRLNMTVLLPERRRVVKIGGPGHEFEDPYGVNNKVDGWDPARQPVAQYAGSYRLEVIPAVASLNDVFLNVLEANDADGPPPTPARLLQGAGFIGTAIGSRLVLFSRTEAYVSEGDIVVDVPGTYRMLVADLKPGSEYDVAGEKRYATAAGLVYATVAAASPNTRVMIKATGRTLSPPAGSGNPRLVQ